MVKTGIPVIRELSFDFAAASCLLFLRSAMVLLAALGLGLRVAKVQLGSCFLFLLELLPVFMQMLWVKSP